MESDRAELTGILKAAAEHRGTALVEIYQNCPIFNDGAFEVLKDRSQQEARIVRLRSGEPVAVGVEGERKLLVRKGAGTMKFIAEAEAATGEAGAVVVHDPALDDPSQAFQLSRLDTPEMSHVPMGIFRQVAAPDLRRPGPRPGRGRHRHRGRPGHRRRPRRPAARTRHLDRRVTSRAPAGDGGGRTRPTQPPTARSRKGTVYGFLAYGIWGLFPLYFAALKPAGALEILGHRILWTLAVCALVLLVRRDLGWIRPFVARPRLVGGITIAALLIATNWTIYVLGRAHRAHLRGGAGLLPQPIVTVALGVVVLGERLRPLQWAAVGDRRVRRGLPRGRRRGAAVDRAHPGLLVRRSTA